MSLMPSHFQRQEEAGLPKFSEIVLGTEEACSLENKYQGANWRFGGKRVHTADSNIRGRDVGPALAELTDAPSFNSESIKNLKARFQPMNAGGAHGMDLAKKCNNPAPQTGAPRT